MSLDATVGGVNANSYLTRAEADAYWATRLFTDTWDDTEEASKDAALEWATRLIDALLVWTGVAASETQALGWPRSGMLSRNGFSIAEDVIPNDLKNAVAEFAGQLAADDRTEDDDILRTGLSSLKVGPVTLAFKNVTANNSNVDIIRQWPGLMYVSQAMPDAVRQLIPASWYTRDLLTQPILFEADE